MTTLEILVHHQIAQSIIIAEGTTEGKKSLIILALCNNHTLLISHRGVFFLKKNGSLTARNKEGKKQCFSLFLQSNRLFIFTAVYINKREVLKRNLV
jgi:hypothetical protein